jgi:hypothetical protein
MKKPLKVLYAIYSSSGELLCTYSTLKEAEADGWGPAFRPHYTIRKYRLVPAAEFCSTRFDA